MNCVDSIPLIAALLYLRSKYDSHGAGKGNVLLAAELSKEIRGPKISDTTLSGFVSGNLFFKAERADALQLAAEALLEREGAGWTIATIPPKIRYDSRYGMKAQKSVGVEVWVRGHGNNLTSDHAKKLSGLWRAFYIPDLIRTAPSEPDIISNFFFIRGYSLTPVASVVLFEDDNQWDGSIHVLADNPVVATKPLRAVIYWSKNAREPAVGYCSVIDSKTNRHLMFGIANLFDPQGSRLPHSHFFCAQKVGVNGQSLLDELRGSGSNLDDESSRSCFGAAEALLAGENLTDDQRAAIKKLRVPNLKIAEVQARYPEVYSLLALLRINGIEFLNRLESGEINLKISLEPNDQTLRGWDRSNRSQGLS